MRFDHEAIDTAITIAGRTRGLLAEQSGISAATIQRLQRGKRDRKTLVYARKDTLTRLADALGVPVESFLKETGGLKK